MEFLDLPEGVSPEFFDIRPEGVSPEFFDTPEGVSVEFFDIPEGVSVELNDPRLVSVSVRLNDLRAFDIGRVAADMPVMTLASSPAPKNPDKGLLKVLFLT